ncbi:MAG: hypothetical protein JWQ54_5015 [Mucilaginibacter sp.]|nr:hypothetical protein [Mucilaginibacter sp.]
MNSSYIQDVTNDLESYYNKINNKLENTEQIELKAIIERLKDIPDNIGKMEKIKIALTIMKFMMESAALLHHQT